MDTTPPASPAMQPHPVTEDLQVVNKGGRRDLPKFKLPKFLNPKPILIVVSVLLALGGAYYGVNLLKQKQAQKLAQEQEVQRLEQERIAMEEQKRIEETVWRDYINTEDEFKFMYPPKTTFTEPSLFSIELPTYTVLFTGDMQSEEVFEEKDLFDGYFFKLVVHKDLSNPNLDQFISQKRDAYTRQCDESATINDILDTKVGFLSAQTFSVEDCDLNYIETFLIRGTDLYEFITVYAGDLGVRQTYVNASNEILNTFAYTNIVQPSPKETWETFTYDEARSDSTPGYTIAFMHPTELDSLCCDIPGPISDSAEKMLVLADAKSKTEETGSTFNGIGVYIDENVAGDSFDDYLQKQRTLLIENYRVVVGKEPALGESSYSVAGVEGVLLSGYAWWGDVVFVQILNTPHVLALSKTESSSDAFTGVFDEIVSTLSVTGATQPQL